MLTGKILSFPSSQGILNAMLKNIEHQMLKYFPPPQGLSTKDLAHE